MVGIKIVTTLSVTYLLLVLSPEEVPAQDILASEGTRELVDGRPRATCLRLSVPPEWWTKKVSPFFRCSKSTFETIKIFLVFLVVYERELSLG